MIKLIPEEVFPPQVYYTNTPLARPIYSECILRPLGCALQKHFASSRLLSESILHPLSRLDGIGHCCRFLRQAGFTSSRENENLDDDVCIRRAALRVLSRLIEVRGQ